jgi:large subunit ribosomal protein L32
MTPLPKRKTPRSKTRTRRSHDHIQLPHIVECNRCRSPKVAHRACRVCNTYRGRTVFETPNDDLE